MRTLLSLIFVLLSIIGIGQNLTFDQIQSLRTKSLGEVEEYLAAKNWTIARTTQADIGSLSDVTFIYNQSAYDETKGEGWLHFYVWEGDNSQNRIKILIGKKSAYQLYLVRLKANGYKLIKTEVVDGGIKKVYKSKNLACEIITGQAPGVYSSIPVYHVSLLTRKSFEELEN